ncbi:MAG: ABC transporter ATP-binding protein [Rhodobacteraceae bacterium]|nr:ABC transporter ATP-binding protein [Paracoccaceae bacterium]
MSILEARDLTKIYSTGFTALNSVNLEIREGEVMALLGPNGAGKTTLISIICGITEATAGTVLVGGHDNVTSAMQARQLIGLVPQEITLEPFEKVIDTMRFSRGLFGMRSNDAHLDRLLDKLSLTDKRESRVHTLSGGMRRRVLIAKALSHEPRILFLDEPTAGVDVELRNAMWQTVSELKDDGVTIILTTHYIVEAEAIADRVAIINKGEIRIVEDKQELMARMGEKQITIELADAISMIPDVLAEYNLELSSCGRELDYRYDARASRTGITTLLNGLREAGLQMTDIQTRQSTLEEIFVKLMQDDQ